MRIVFQGDQRQTPWNLPMINKEDECAIMDWAEENKTLAEGINGVAQLVRLIQEILEE